MHFLLSFKFSACFHLVLVVAVYKVQLAFKFLCCFAKEKKNNFIAILIYNNLFSNIMQKLVKIVKFCTFLILTVIVVMVDFWGSFSA